MSNHELNWKKILSISNKSQEDYKDILSLIHPKVKESINNHITQSNCHLYGFETEEIKNIKDKVLLLDNNRLLMIFIYQNDIYRNYKVNQVLKLGNLNQFDYLINQFSEPVIEENNKFKRFKEWNENSIRAVRNKISEYYNSNYQNNNINNINSLNNYLENFQKISEDYIGEFIKKQNTLFEKNIQELNKYQRKNENFKLSELSTKVIFNLLTIDDGFQGYSYCLLNRLNINGNLIPKFLRILENKSQEFINDKILNYSKRCLDLFKQIIEFVKDYKFNSIESTEKTESNEKTYNPFTLKAIAYNKIQLPGKID